MLAQEFDSGVCCLVDCVAFAVDDRVHVCRGWLWVWIGMQKASVKLAESSDRQTNDMTSRYGLLRGCIWRIEHVD
jgi:hypothetical protein